MEIPPSILGCLCGVGRQDFVYKSSPPLWKGNMRAEERPHIATPETKEELTEQLASAWNKLLAAEEILANLASAITKAHASLRKVIQGASNTDEAGIQSRIRISSGTRSRGEK